MEDIRDRPRLSHEDILRLNFIRTPGKVLFRRHYRFGLRSHIMEVLNPEDVEKEIRGVTLKGLKWFPKARPMKMLRIFRAKFRDMEEAREELARVKIVEAHLAPYNLATSNEFLVDYLNDGKMETLLCGLQEYVEGEILDPWGYLDLDRMASLLCPEGPEENEGLDSDLDQWSRDMLKKAKNFIGRLRKMILETRHVPDLAGVGNLLLTPSGDIKLVDINNISEVFFDSKVRLDDRGYPVCDKSIEALFLLEKMLINNPGFKDDPIYHLFLAPERVKEVKAIEMAFHDSEKSEKSDS